MRQLDDSTSLIAHRGYVPHFCACEQTFILRVIPSNRMEEVHVFDGRETHDLEIAQPPQMQPFSHHRMNPAVEDFLFIRVPAGAIGEMLPAGQTLGVARAGDSDEDAPDRTREASTLQHRPYFLLRSLRVAQLPGTENVKVDDDVMVRRNSGDHGKQSTRRIREF